ncbi:MAG: hypothetical protein WC869_13020 [Phycisphaerae bacterium]|jgi:hypothetical protein
MKPDPRFLRQPKNFWAHVRSISQQIGYTRRRTSQIQVPTITEIDNALSGIGLRTGHIVTPKGAPTDFGQLLVAYFGYRAEVLNKFVEPRLMDAEDAKRLFKEVRGKTQWTCPLPMNKQKGKKKAPAFLTCIVNMLIEANSSGLPCEYDPRELTTFTRDSIPLRTLCRRVDGAFPYAINPQAIWEIKEYYYTTTFGSRVADGVYETLVDGMELEELREREGVDTKHYLMVDSHETWWEMGRSYLCRIVDMLHMGYVDEVLFGREVVERLPALVKEWVAAMKLPA